MSPCHRKLESITHKYPYTCISYNINIILVDTKNNQVFQMLCLFPKTSLIQHLWQFLRLMYTYIRKKIIHTFSTQKEIIDISGYCYVFFLSIFTYME